VPITIYGIKNCDTMKKARAWLDGHGIAYEFHDYKKAGIDRQRLATWSKMVGWETLLNRAGTTFRKLPDTDKQGIDEKKAIDLMLAPPRSSSGRCSISPAASCSSASSLKSTRPPSGAEVHANISRTSGMTLLP
jgi:arsenate reductase